MTRKWWTALLAATALAPMGALAQPRAPVNMQGTALLASCRASEPVC